MSDLKGYEKGKELHPLSSSAEALVTSSPKTMLAQGELATTTAVRGPTVAIMSEASVPPLFSPVVQPFQQLGLPGNRQLDLLLPADSESGSDAMSVHYQPGTELGRPLIDRHDATRPQSTRGRRAWISWRTLLVVVVCVFGVATYEYAAEHLHDHESPHHTNIPEADRDTAIWECAEQLSGAAAVLPDGSPRKLAVQEFLAGVASDVPISGDCSWQSAFGTIYGILVLRESLAVAHPSWHPVHKLIGPFDVCHWAGIKCNLRKDVQGIFLNNANLTGTIPAEIAGFAASLSTLHLFTNDDIIGTLPHEMGELTNLEVMFLHETKIAGSVPASFGSLGKLQQLLLDHTHLTGTMPQEVCDLRLFALSSLHADCLGPHAKVQCSTLTCCTSCY